MNTAAIPRKPARSLTKDGTIVCGGFSPRPDGTHERAHYDPKQEAAEPAYYAVVQPGESCPIWLNSEGGPL